MYRIVLVEYKCKAFHNDCRAVPLSTELFEVRVLVTVYQLLCSKWSCVVVVLRVEDGVLGFETDYVDLRYVYDFVFLLFEARYDTSSYRGLFTPSRQTW